MSYWAKVLDNEVLKVIVAEEEFFETFVDSSPGKWIETTKDNYAGVGMTYDEDRDAFIPKKPYSSWVLNETTCNWDAPSAYPDDGKMYSWNEETLAWVEVV